MSDDLDLQDDVDASWLRISRFRPIETDVETLAKMLKHPRWEVRWNAARELYYLKDECALDALIDLLKNDPDDTVRSMAAQAIGALHESGVSVPFYQRADNPDRKTQVQIVLARLRELRVQVTLGDGYYTLLIPHKLSSPEYVEIGYLLAQLVDVPFPQGYSPLRSKPSLVVPHRRDPWVDFRDSYHHGLKYHVKMSERD